MATSVRRSLASARSDERLARLVAKEGQAPFTELYERYHQALYRYCRSIVRDEHDAQDALQSAMAGAFAALRKGERDLAVRPWLFRIAHNESVSLLRRRRPQEIAADEMAFAAPANISEPTLVIEQRERLARLLSDLRGLTLRQRSVLVMRELSGLSIAEIAEACATTQGAVKQALYEAREALRESEQGRSMECEQVRRMICEEDRRALRGRRLSSHLQACSGCRELAETIATRGQDLRLLVPPLPAAGAAALLSRLLDAGTSVPTGLASGASSAAAGGAQATVAGSSSGTGAATSGLGATAGGGAAPSIAAHTGGAIAAKVLTAAMVVAVGAVGVARVAAPGPRHQAVSKAAAPHGAAASHSVPRAGGSERLGSGSRPPAGGARAATKRALVSAHDRRALAPLANGHGRGHHAQKPGNAHQDGHSKVQASPGQSAGGVGKATAGERPRSNRAAAPGKSRSGEHRSSHSRRPAEHASRKTSPQDNPKPPKEAARGKGHDKQPGAASGQSVESESTSVQAQPSEHGKGAH